MLSSARKLLRQPTFSRFFSSQSTSSQSTSSQSTSQSTNVASVLLNDFTPDGANDKVKQAMSLRNASRKDLVKFQKKGAVEEFQRFPGDTGSSPVQIASLTVRIEALRSHCSQHKKDKHNRRGLDALVTKRRKLMQYLERKDFDSYADVVKKLGLKALK
ncbi:hypothetical protein TrRE_jg2628 [Triparma retinervis]|uniref:30S ribosomal protein S15 n=1 Tax=Triparma retinervis TaxID=2557542 RepID=A0A9W7E734_9STRA|nr:hypothetical protein TrRE_jg2628 [Triparma retinervis]